MTFAEIGPLVSVIVPIIVAAVGGLFGYRQAVKVADRTSSVDSRKLTLAEYESLNRGLQAEVDRLRGDRIEDEERFERRAAGLEARIDRLEGLRGDAETSLHRLLVWTRMVLAVARRPEVSTALTVIGVEFPALPPGLLDVHDQLQPARRAPDGG